MYFLGRMYKELAVICAILATIRFFTPEDTPKCTTATSWQELIDAILSDPEECHQEEKGIIKRVILGIVLFLSTLIIFIIYKVCYCSSTTHKRHPVSVVQKNCIEQEIYGHGVSVSKPLKTRDVQPVSASIKATGQTYRTKVGNYTVQVVTSSDECKYLIRQIRSHCENFPVIGFDCEWWSIKGPRRPVALLQLASPGGLCVLARLCQMNSLPTELLHLLGDVRIIKVGVQPLEDGYKLQQDYGCKVVSTLDLRHLAHWLNVPRPYKLSALAERVTNLQMDTDWQIPASNWERYELSPRQIEYAAKDAIAGLLIARTFNKAIPLSGMGQYYDIPFKL